MKILIKSILLSIIFPFILLASKYEKVFERMDELSHGSKLSVIESQHYIKEKRIEVSPIYGFTMNDPYVNTTFMGLALTYHLSEFWGFEASYLDANSSETALTLSDDLSNFYEPGKIASMPISFMSLNVLFSPIYAKMSIFSNLIMHYDMYFTAGAGVNKTNWESAFAYNFGVGFRIYLFKRISLGLNLRDSVQKEERKSSTISKHNLLTYANLSVFLF